MVKSAIKVVVRVRPTPDFAQGAIDLHQDKKVRVPKHNARFFRRRNGKRSVPELHLTPWRSLQSVKLHLPKLYSSAN